MEPGGFACADLTVMLTSTGRSRMMEIRSGSGGLGPVLLALAATVAVRVAAVATLSHLSCPGGVDRDHVSARGGYA